MKIYIEENGRIRAFEGEDAVVAIGRGGDNQVVIKDPRSSRRHCRVLETPQGFFLEDLQSRNGTALNGSKIKRSALSPGDVFQVGSTRFYFESLPESKAGGAFGGEESGPDEVSSGEISAVETLVAPKTPARQESDDGVVLEEVEGVEGVEEIEAEAAPSPRPSAAAKRRTRVTAQDAFLEGLKGLHVGERIPITKVPYTIGRKADNDFRLEDRRASGHHARIVVRDDIFYVEDLGSRNGTFINGKPIRGEVRLAPGMRLQIGDCQYRVQVPGADGDVAVEAAADADAGSDYELSRFKAEELLQDSRRSGQPLVALGLLVILGALLYFAVDVALKVIRRSNPDPRIEGNLLIDNWSFEEAPETTNGQLSGWIVPTESGGTIERTKEGAQYPGFFALRLDGGPRADELALAAYAERIRVTPGAKYYVSGHVSNQSSPLGAGIVVRWLRGGGEGGQSPTEVARTYTNAVTQVGYGEEVGRWLTPPENAALAEIGCFVLGGSGLFDRIYFGADAPPHARSDDVALDELATDGEGPPSTDTPAGKPQIFVRDEPVELVATPPPSKEPTGDLPAPVRAELRSDGTLAHVRRQRLPRVLAMWPGLPPERDPLGLGPRLACEPFASQERVLRLSCQVPDLVDQSWCRLEINVQTEGGQLACRYRYRRAPDREPPPEVAVYLELAPRTSAKAFGETDVIEIGPSSAPARELVVGDGSEQIVFQFDPPLVFRELDRQALLVGTAKLDHDQGDTDLRVVLSRTSRREEQTIRAITEEARRLHAEGELSSAVKLLQSIIANYAWRRDDIERTRRILAEWAAEGELVLERIEADFALLREIPSELVYENLLARCRKALERHRGTPVADAVTAKMEAARAHWKGLRSTEETRRLEALYARGLEHFGRNEIHLAEFCLREVRRASSDEDLIQRLDERLSIIEKKKQTRALDG